jgi:hypothetical protein
LLLRAEKGGDGRRPATRKGGGPPRSGVDERGRMNP